MKILKKINWKQILLDNWVLKLISLSLAFALWFVVITEEDPIDTKTFYGVTVNLINTEKLKELGRVYEVLDGTDTVRSVTVEAPGSILDKLSSSDIIAQADLNNISGMDTVEIEYFCPSYSRDIIDIKGNISNVKLSIEEKMKKSLYIRYQEVGQVADGYMVGGIALEHTRLEVEGPETKITQIAKAIVDVDITGASTDFSTPLDVNLFDENGNKLDFSSVEQSVKTVNVSAKILKVKEIPVEYIPMGQPADGYLLTGVVNAEPTAVKVAGSPKAINGIAKITVSEELNMEGATETLEKDIDLEKYIGNCIFADKNFNGIAHVTIPVEEEAEKNLTLRRENLQIINVPAGINAEVVIDQTIPELHVTGLQQNLSFLRESTLKGTIDVAAWMEQLQSDSLELGVHSIPVQFDLAEGQNAENEVLVQILFAEIVPTAIQ